MNPLIILLQASCNANKTDYLISFSFIYLHVTKYYQCDYSTGLPAVEGWVCDFEGVGDCMNFRSSGWVNHKPQRHTDDIEYEPDHDHTKNDDYGMFY